MIRTLATTAVLVACIADAQVRDREPLSLVARHRVEPQKSTDDWLVKEKLTWDPGRTAIIICDMWNEHWCAGATARVAELAPRMNKFVSAARGRGVFIVHAPSGTLDAYAGHPARLRAQNVPVARDLPAFLGSWCRGIETEEGIAWPLDQSDGGCDCVPQCAKGNPWTSQIDAIEIKDEDALSDSGVEIASLFAERGIENVMLMGVHTNMCVIGRPFGLRNMVRLGKNTVLVRDLTDTMYNPRMDPHVDHFTGTDLVIDYIESYVCPTIDSTSLLRGKPFKFKQDKRGL